MPGESFDLQMSGARMLVSIVRSDIIHFTYLPGETPAPPNRGWTSRTSPPDSNRESIRTSSETFHFHTADLRVEVNGLQGLVTVHNAEGYLLFQDRLMESDSSKVQMQKQIDPTARLYGFGEKTGALDKRGRLLEMWNTDVLAYGEFAIDEDPLYQSHPMFIAASENYAWGLYADVTHRTRFDTGTEDPALLGTSRRVK